MKLVSTLLLASTAQAFVSHTPSTVSTSLYAEETETVTGAAAISGLTSGLETIYTSQDIDKLLPHRYPFALVDKVVEYEAGKRAVGIKAVTKVRIIGCIL